MLNLKKMTVIAVAGVLSLGMNSASASAAKMTAGRGQEAKNVIVMIADGWGENQILAANYYNAGRPRNEAYELFPTRTYMSTYSLGSYDPSSAWADGNYINHRPTDSAAAGTAMSTGVKTYDAGIGVDEQGESVKHIAEYFEEAGRSTGVVSSVQFYHATPAAFVAHDVSRNNYNSIAHEMIDESVTDVVMAAGHPGFNDNGEAIAVNYRNLNKMSVGTQVIDGQTLWTELTGGVAGADADGDGIADPWTFIESKDDFEALTSGDTPDRVFGVPQVASTLQQGRGGDRMAAPNAVEKNDNVPDLATMSKAALNVLDNNENGLFLMIEGGAIDWAGHANQLGRNIEEMNEFNDAVDAVIDWVEDNSSWGETLLIVTGDHVAENCARAAALAMNAGCQFEQRYPTYADLFLPETSENLLDSIFEDLNLPIDPSGGSAGSTDAGNIDQVIPVFHPTVAITSGKKIPLHHQDFEKLMKQDAGYQGMRNAAKLLVLLVSRLSNQEGLFDGIKREHEQHRTKRNLESLG